MTDYFWMIYRRLTCYQGNTSGGTIQSIVATSRLSNSWLYLRSRVLIDPTPMPSNIPRVEEVGVSSAPLKSASFFIGAKCAPYNDDYMLCKAENAGQDEAPCLAAGRRVTRCTSDVLSSIQKSCLETFNAHWQCLDDQNQDFKNCRPAERALNKCVFENMVRYPMLVSLLCAGVTQVYRD